MLLTKPPISNCLYEFILSGIIVTNVVLGYGSTIISIMPHDSRLVHILMLVITQQPSIFTLACTRI